MSAAPRRATPVADMTLTATFTPTEFPEEVSALLLSGDADGLRDLADRFAARTEGQLPLAPLTAPSQRVFVRLAFCDTAEDERFAATGSHLRLTLSPASADQASVRVRSLIGLPRRAFRYLDLRRPAHAAFSVVVRNY